MPQLDRQSNVFVLHLGETTGDDEHVLTTERMEQLTAQLDEIEASSGPAALVTTGSGKFYSTGFQPERFAGDPDEVREYVMAGQRLFARVLASEVPTVAAVQGHAFGGGALLSAAHDVRIMRSDRGFWCLPEIQLGLVIPVGMSRLIQQRLPGPTAHQAILTGKRYGGADALAAGIVDAVADEASLLTTAVAIAEQLAGTRGRVLAEMKRELFRDALAALASDEGIEPQTVVSGS